MDRFIANSEKVGGSNYHPFPTSWKKGKSLLEDECTNDNKHDIFALKFIVSRKVV